MKAGTIFTAAVGTLALTAGALAIKANHDKSAAIELLTKATAANMRDPESAKFRALTLRHLDGPITDRIKALPQTPPSNWMAALTYAPKGFELCGEVNAKNGFGAYAGYEAFNTPAYTDDMHPMIDGDSSHLAAHMCELSSANIVAAVE